MNQQRLKDYLTLIQNLLRCPEGEEWILLRQHEDLVNSELIQVMEQVAAQVAADGYADAGKYLHNWAAQLHHILVKEVVPPAKSDDQSQAYLRLIQTLLDSPRSKVAEVLAEHQELIGPGLVHMMQQVALKMAKQGDQKTAHFLRELAVDLNRAWLKAHAFQPNLGEKKEDRGTPATTQDRPPQPLQHPQAPEPISARQRFEAIPTVRSDGSPAPVPARASTQQLEQQLAAIAASIDRLSQTLTARLQPLNPLWYMDVLERAHTSNWVLTTSEVEQLIGVKPHCLASEETYHRGCWIFLKAGKIGAQAAWRVAKESGDLAADKQ